MVSLYSYPLPLDDLKPKLAQLDSTFKPPTFETNKITQYKVCNIS